ncbi:MAG: hypothetical protein ACKO34_05395 [Vampirovibrionales bacterium]
MTILLQITNLHARVVEGPEILKGIKLPQKRKIYLPSDAINIQPLIAQAEWLYK